MPRRPHPIHPRAEGLEPRALLSVATVSPQAEVQLAEPAPMADAEPTLNSTAAPQQVAENGNGQLTPRERFQQRREEILAREAESIMEQRIRRITNLPFFLQQLDPDRPLPTEAVETIQHELFSIINSLQPPGEAVAKGFISVLRATIPNASLTPAQVNQLNNAFGTLLLSAQAPPETVDALKGAMLELSQNDIAFSATPVVTLTNDYALILQTALSVGRPINPTIPGLNPQAVPGGPFGLNNPGLNNLGF